MGKRGPLPHPAGGVTLWDQGWSPGPGCEERCRTAPGCLKVAPFPGSEPCAALEPRGGELGRCGLFRRVCAPEGKGERRRGGEDGLGMGLESPTPSHPNLPASLGSDETDPGADRGFGVDEIYVCVEVLAPARVGMRGKAVTEGREASQEVGPL